MFLKILWEFMTDLLTTKEAMSILGCTLSTFRHYVSRGLLCPFKKQQGKNYFDKDTIESFKPSDSPMKGLVPRRLSSGLDPSVVMTIIQKWRVNSRDNSSADVQIGVYTEKIRLLEGKISRLPIEDIEFRGMRFKLLVYVAERRKLLRYLEISDYRRYRRAMELIRKEAA